MKFVRILLMITTAFLAITAVGGGIAILTGVDQFPSEWLADSIFSGYTFPAFILIFAVGGSSLLAFISLWRKMAHSKWFVMSAGMIMMGQITAEIIILQQQPPGPTFIEIFYFALGLIVFLTAFFFRKDNALLGWTSPVNLFW